jgi:hypothetical protein
MNTITVKQANDNLYRIQLDTKARAAASRCRRESWTVKKNEISGKWEVGYKREIHHEFSAEELCEFAGIAIPEKPR